mmetsp:Transcript_92275/g.128129  ORF Transcript_92275/g.128129 Transcript_92275/m.128129 type:complete len:130 (+) Transcript_92275:94-483(+)
MVGSPSRLSVSGAGGLSNATESTMTAYKSSMRDSSFNDEALLDNLVKGAPSRTSAVWDNWPRGDGDVGDRGESGERGGDGAVLPLCDKLVEPVLVRWERTVYTAECLDNSSGVSPLWLQTCGSAPSSRR